MKPARGLRFLVAAAALVLALVAVGCTLENVTIRERALGGTNSAAIFGEVNNHTDSYAQVEVKGSLFDAGGTVIASPSTRACPYMVKPHDTVVFGVSYTGTPPVANYELHVESTPMEAVPDASLSISDVRIERDENKRLHVIGVITDIGSERYEYIRVCAAFYDSSGKVDGFLFAFAPDVDPGQTASFDLSHSPLVEQGEPSSNAVTYRLWVEPSRTPSTGNTYRGYVSTDKLSLP